MVRCPSPDLMASGPDAMKPRRASSKSARSANGSACRTSAFLWRVAGSASLGCAQVAEALTMQAAPASNTGREEVREEWADMCALRSPSGAHSWHGGNCRSLRIPTPPDRIVKSDLSIPESRGRQLARLGSNRERHLRRYSLGVIPAVSLKARLNGASD